jgi:uncharacterized membrane protein
MSRRDRTDGPWAPSDYFTNGGVLLVIGVLLVNAAPLVAVGVILLVVGAVMVLIGVVRKGAETSQREGPD